VSGRSHRCLALWRERVRQQSNRSARASGTAYLLASLASFLTWPPADSASRACGSIRCTTARPGFAEKSLSGRFGAGALRPVFGCNGVFALR
jgi:hypothetical protein